MLVVDYCLRNSCFDDLMMTDDECIVLLVKTLILHKIPRKYEARLAVVAVSLACYCSIRNGPITLFPELPLSAAVLLNEAHIYAFATVD